MIELKSGINKIDILFKQVLQIFDELNNDNFNEKLNLAVKNMNEAEIIKNQLKSFFPESELKPFDNELHTLAKQIEEKFDNIVENIREEQKEINKQIQQYYNKRKLANYHR